MQTSHSAGIDATLTSRYECKYFVSEERARRIRDEIRPFLSLDPYSAQQERERYPVYSLYFDSPGFRLFQDTVEGARNRFKLRLRYYDAEGRGPVFAEVKKRNDQIVRKSRDLLQDEHRARLLDAGQDSPYRYWTDLGNASLTNRDVDPIFEPGRAAFLLLRESSLDDYQYDDAE